MTVPTNTISGLSQWVICRKTPYSIEIFRESDAEDWTVEAVDVIGNTTIWSGTAPDEPRALIAAMSHIHNLQTPQPRLVVA